MKLPELPYRPNLPIVLREVAHRFGDRDFIVTADKRLSYLQAEAASRRIARHLLATGVGKGTRVGLQLENGIEWVLAWLAVTRIGGILVTLSTAYKPAELARTARHADLHTLITQDRLFDADHLESLGRAFPELERANLGQLLINGAPYLRAIRVNGTRQAEWSRSIDLSIEAPDSGFMVDDALLEAVESEVTPADPMIVIYTSGTTGEPKGVVHTHGSALRHGYQLADFIGLNSNWRYYCGAPFFWVAGIGIAVGASMHKGAAVLTLGKHDHRTALELMRRESATHIVMWPTVLQKLDHYIEQQHVDVSDIPAYAEVKAGRVNWGMPPGHNSLGMTETWGPHSGPGRELGRVLPRELAGSFGMPADYVEMKTIDVETGATLPPEDEGELCVRGYSLMDGFYKRERHEALDDDGWLHTGDSVRFRDGYLFFVARRSEMIKSAGANVAPGEVEAALYAAPGVGYVVALGLPDAERGEIVGAALVPRPGKSLDLATIRAKAEELLSSYKQPRKYLLLAEEELPYLASGKPDKKKLRERLLERGI